MDDLGFGMGERSNRFAVLAEDGKVKHAAMDTGSDPNPNPNPDPDPDPNPYPNPKVKHVAMDEGMDTLDSTSVDAINKVSHP